MATQDAVPVGTSNEAQADIRSIDSDDLMDVLKMGIDDFLACPSHLVLLAVIYPVIGMVLARLAFGYDMLPLLFPIVSGFALIGPLAATGPYEISRRREQGLDVSWKNAFDVFTSRANVAILILGIIQLAIYIAWLFAAYVVYWMTFGSAVPESIQGFAYDVLTTPAGWALIVVGCGVGFLFALLVLLVSAVSFPMLVHRDVHPLFAVQTSVRAVSANFVTMSTWGVIVTMLLVVGMIPFFVGLAVVMPVLGHATWHLYRRLVIV